MRPVRLAAGRRLRSILRSGRTEVVVALVAATVTTGLVVILADQRLSPVFFGDEIGYLANAIAMAGGPALHISADSYYPGWSLVLVPVWWLVPDPLPFYRIAVLLSALSCVATIPVLSALARRLGLRRAHAVTAASVVVALPAHSLMAGFALSESFLGLVVCAAALLGLIAAQRAHAHGGLATAAWFAAAGAASGFAFTVHGRLVGLVAATVLWAVLLLARKRWGAGSALLVSALAVAGAGYALNRHLELVLYHSTGRETTGVAELLASQPGATALTASGQIWYAVVATAGLALPGVALVARGVRREIDDRQPGWACWTAVWILGLLVVSVGYMSGSVATHERLDIYVYGRYLEPATDVLAFLGLVRLTTSVGRLRRRLRGPVVLVAVFAVVAIGYGFAAAALVPTAEHTRSGWNPMNVFGLALDDWLVGHGDHALPLVQAGLVGGGVLVGLLLVRRTTPRPTWLLAGALVFALTGAVIGQARTVGPVYGQYQTAFRLAPLVTRAGDPTVSFDTAADWRHPQTSTVISQNAYQFFLAPNDVRLVDSDRAMPRTDLVIARRSWALGTIGGWKRAAVDSRFDNALWVRPGTGQAALVTRLRSVPGQ
ncbi:hypothetical protein AX769_13530 [Frondihabitans sp. PAMC 28766]|nr:hypothetical protein AX769_13530 [Frondihabitans sp. PAMC 28766]